MSFKYNLPVGVSSRPRYNKLEIFLSIAWHVCYGIRPWYLVSNLLFDSNSTHKH